jgi:uncharacterized membrane protein YhiD involved in acid resistance
MRCLVLSALLVHLATPLSAQATAAAKNDRPRPAPKLPPVNGSVDDQVRFDLKVQLNSLTHAAISLPLAAVLGAGLAFRPRRRGTPPRSASVIQTQLILAVVGAMVMLIVGASLARAFGIVGAASLIRYRAKVNDPKDAGVMLSTLAIGLASGVGLYVFAVFGTLFVMGVLWVVESLEPEQQKAFLLRVATKQPTDLRPVIEQLLRRQRVPFELRTSSHEEVCYEVLLPFDQRTDRLSNAILALDPSKETEVQWEEKKTK